MPGQASWRWAGSPSRRRRRRRGAGVTLSRRSASPDSQPALHSGTTGTPKGTAFRHGQVLWLAETWPPCCLGACGSAGALPVVPADEPRGGGILGTYAPYFLSAPWTSGSEDFYALSKALPACARPCFLRARFYEKVWERSRRRPPAPVPRPPAGRAAARCGAGEAGRPAPGRPGPLRQLMVGSAPCPTPAGGLP